MLTKNRPIWNSAILQEKIKQRHGLELTKQQICKIMRKEFRLGYRRVGGIPVQANSERCLVLRQQYALRMVGVLEQAKRVINIDESWINQTQYNRRVWAPTDSPATATLKMITPRLSLIAALDTSGKVWFSLLHANTDSDIMVLFLSQLFQQLDEESPGWRANSVVLLDGAKYHTSEQCAAYLRLSGATVMYSGPYSYGKCPKSCCSHHGCSGPFLYLLTFFSLFSQCAHRAALRQLQDRGPLRRPTRPRQEVSNTAFAAP
jgi:hypothetical protein